MQYLFKEIPGVIKTTAGYTGGTLKNPTYKQVCAGGTGHLEAIEVVFDPAKTNYETLAKMFFEVHDPTQENGQGPDIGEQYQSAIFYTSNAQKEAALSLIQYLKGQSLKAITQVRPAGPFYRAEEYHQDYYNKTGGHPYCHRRVKRF
jgi:peptide methionine sulfoxide reductase msrA/msrB